MITYETENYIILCPKFRIFSKKSVEEIRTFFFNTQKYKQPVIDMSNIDALSQDFFEFIDESRKRVILLNPSAEVFALLNLTGYDNKVKLYVNTIDLEEDKRELRNRKFSIVSTVK